LNCDEINLTNDAKRKKMTFKAKTKDPRELELSQNQHIQHCLPLHIMEYTHHHKQHIDASEYVKEGHRLREHNTIKQIEVWQIQPSTERKEQHQNLKRKENNYMRLPPSQYLTLCTKVILN
jgi:hypothetical protein